MESRDKCRNSTDNTSTNFGKAAYQMHPLSIFNLDIYSDVSERDVKTMHQILPDNLSGFTSKDLQLAQAIGHQIMEQYMNVVYM